MRNDLSRNEASLFLLALLLSLMVPAVEGAVSEQPEQLEMKEVTGALVYKTGQVLTLEYSKSPKGSYEVVLPMGKDVRLERLRDLAELQTGDILRVRYREVSKPGKTGEKVIVRTEATNVSLVRKATPDALVSKGQEE